jgi:hypothetical protein
MKCASARCISSSARCSYLRLYASSPIYLTGIVSYSDASTGFLLLCDCSSSLRLYFSYFSIDLMCTLSCPYLVRSYPQGLLRPRSGGTEVLPEGKAYNQISGGRSRDANRLAEFHRKGQFNLCLSAYSTRQLTALPIQSSLPRHCPNTLPLPPTSSLFSGPSSGRGSGAQSLQSSSCVPSCSSRSFVYVHAALLGRSLPTSEHSRSCCTWVCRRK